MRCFFGFCAMIFLVAFAAKDVVAVENASWGKIKASMDSDEVQPAGKLVVSAERAGDVNYIVYRQMIGGDPKIVGDEYGLPMNLAFRTVPGVDNIYAQQDGEYLLVVMDVDASLIDPEAKEFGLSYVLGNDRVQAKTRFFGYDAERTQYMVQFSVSYIGSPAQEHILGRASGEAVMSFWYTPENRQDDKEDTRINFYFASPPEKHPVVLKIYTISFNNGVEEYRWTVLCSRVSIDPLTGYGYISIFMPRIIGERFFLVKAWYLYGFIWPPPYPISPDKGEFLGEWEVQFPFVEKLDVILEGSDVVHVGVPRK